MLGLGEGLGAKEKCFGLGWLKGSFGPGLGFGLVKLYGWRGGWGRVLKRIQYQLSRSREDADDDAEEEGFEEEAESSPSKKVAPSGSSKDLSNPSPNKEKWFDAETKTRKAERMWEQQMQNFRRDMDKVNTDMTAVLTEFRSKASDAAEFAAEMLLVQKRQEWLAAVLAPDDSALTSKLATPAESDADGSVTESRDPSAVARAGPCAGYEGLVTVSSLAAKATEFRGCSSKADIQKHLESMVPAKKLLVTLQQACKTAMNELLAARKNAQQNLEKQKEKELKDASAEKKRTSNAAAAGSPQFGGSLKGFAQPGWGSRVSFFVFDFLFKYFSRLKALLSHSHSHSHTYNDSWFNTHAAQPSFLHKFGSFWV